MRFDYTGHITSFEWRWVILVSSALVVLAALPFLWMWVNDIPGGQWEFMGVLHRYQDNAAEMSRIYQGKEGSWLTHYLHTPEPHEGTFNGLFYAVLGQIARVTLVSPIVVFHIARGVTTLFMYLVLFEKKS